MKRMVRYMQIKWHILRSWWHNRGWRGQMLILEAYIEHLEGILEDVDDELRDNRQRLDYLETELALVEDHMVLVS